MARNLARSREPRELVELRDFLHSKLLPLARRGGLIEDGAGVDSLIEAALLAKKRGGKIELLPQVALTASIAAALWLNDHDGSEWAETLGAAQALAQFAHGYATAHCDGLDAAREALSSLGRLGADARHAPTRDARELVLAWWAKCRGKMTKEAAADAIVNERIVGESRTTIRRWLRGA